MKASELQENLDMAKGAWIILIAAAGGMALAFGGRLLLIRFFSPSEYGIFSLAWIILNFSSLLSLMGLQESSARQIAFYESRNDRRSTTTIIRYSTEGILIASIFTSLVLFFLSGYIAEAFKEVQLEAILKAFAVALPFLALTHLLASIFRGFGRTKPKVVFFDLLRNSLFPLLLLPVGLLGIPFQTAMWTFVAANILTGIAFVIYATKRLPRLTEVSPTITRRSLLTFSLPILVLVTSSSAIAWADTVMLGFFKTATTVGLYSSAWAIAQLLLLPAAAVAFLLLPTASKLYEQDLMTNLKRSYTVATRWIMALALPLLLSFLLFPQFILNLLFGAAYVDASNVLRILTLAYSLHFLFGPSHITLTAIGRTRLLLKAAILGVVLNVGLNAFLIPVWGMIGAAAATAVAFAVTYSILALSLYRATKVHPFGLNHLQLLPEDKYILSYLRELLSGNK